MGLVSNENYINIQGWMINELNLSGNNLLVYAIIYGFSQDDGSVFSGSLQYLADWCNATKQGIQKNLKELVDRGLIVKHEVYKNNQKFCEYSCIPYNKVVYPIQQSCINKLEDTPGNKENKSNNKLLDIITPKKGDKKSKNLYSKCSDYISQYTNNVALQTRLEEYLRLRLDIARDEGKAFYYNMWPPIVNNLDALARDTDMAIKIVEQSIQKGWKSFYPLKEYNNSSRVKADATERNVDTVKKSEDELDLVDEVY